MMKLATLIAFLGLLAPACTFDTSGLPSDDCTADCDGGPRFDGPDVAEPVDDFDGAPPAECTADADCDDGSSCTINVCDVSGACRTFDDAEAQCECVTDADCDDSDASTTDSCVDDVCVHESDDASSCGDNTCGPDETHESCPDDCTAPADVMEVHCEATSTDLTVSVTGPVKDGIFDEDLEAEADWLEYGSDTDGWGPYTSGKPKATWQGDYDGDSVRIYVLTLGIDVNNFNFFLYDEDADAVTWFDLDQWTVTGDCHRDGGGIRH